MRNYILFHITKN